MEPLNSILDVCEGLPETALETGSVLLHEGNRTGFLYVLIDGEVEILKGDFQVNTVSESGAIFGELSALLDLPHMATVRALTSVRAYRIEGAANFLHSHPSIALEVARLLAHRLTGVTNYLVDLKRQFEDHDNHFGMVDEILGSIVHHQRSSFIPGSVRDPDPSI